VILILQGKLIRHPESLNGEALFSAFIAQRRNRAGPEAEIDDTEPDEESVNDNRTLPWIRIRLALGG